MQVLEAGLKEPLTEQVMGNHADTLIISSTKLVSAHLIETLAELANGVRNY